MKDKYCGISIAIKNYYFKYKQGGTWSKQCIVATTVEVWEQTAYQWEVARAVKRE
jgi:hypothetical protein